MMRQLKITQAITNRNDKALDSYLTELNHYHMITADDEVALAQRIREGDVKAMQELACANLRFVVSVAKQYQGKGLSLSDLISEGNVGLLRACQDFDDTRGFKFISYAVWWIRQSIMEALANQSRMVRIPMNQVNKLGKLRKATNKYMQSNGEIPDTSMLADDLELTEEEVKSLQNISGHSTSIDTPVHEDSDITVADTIRSDNRTDSNLNKESLHTEVLRTLSVLKVRDQQILKLIFGIDCEVLSLEQIGELFNLSAERVRQIKDRAIKILRKKNLSNLRLYL